MATAKTLESLRGISKAQPVPELAAWTDNFSGWGIWADVKPADLMSGPKEVYGMGLLLTEGRVARQRIVGWGLFFLVVGLVFGFGLGAVNLGLGLLVGTPILIVGLYRLISYYLDKNLRVWIFRDGLVYANRETIAVRWAEVESVTESWTKQTINVVLRFFFHNITVRTTRQQTIKLDRTLENIEELGRAIQNGVAGQKIAGAVNSLQADGILEFGVFQLSRYGITFKSRLNASKPLTLAWDEVQAIKVDSVGQTSITIQKKGGNWLSNWAPVAGGKVLNLYLFLRLARWFTEVAQHPELASQSVPHTETASADERGQDVKYRLYVDVKEIAQPSHKTFFIGYAGREEKLIVNIPANIKSGTLIRCQGYGRPNAQGRSPGTLYLEVLVVKPVKRNLGTELLMFLGALLGIALVMMPWLSPLPIMYDIGLVLFIGPTGGALLVIGQRKIGAIVGLVGGLASYLLQILYIAGMSGWGRRDSFWNYEMVFIGLLSLLPAYGMFKLLTRGKKTEAS